MTDGEVMAALAGFPALRHMAAGTPEESVAALEQYRREAWPGRDPSLSMVRAADVRQELRELLEAATAGRL